MLGRGTKGGDTNLLPPPSELLFIYHKSCAKGNPIFCSALPPFMALQKGNKDMADSTILKTKKKALLTVLPTRKVPLITGLLLTICDK